MCRIQIRMNYSDPDEVTNCIRMRQNSSGWDGSGSATLKILSISICSFSAPGYFEIRAGGDQGEAKRHYLHRLMAQPPGECCPRGSRGSEAQGQIIFLTLSQLLKMKLGVTHLYCLGGPGFESCISYSIMAHSL